jgi:hypothetical protein
VSPLRAVLLFPVCPAAATRALCGRPGAGAVVLLPPLALGAYLAVRGCAAADAAVTAGALLLVILGLGLGGAFAGGLARLILGRPFAVRPHLVGCLAFAAWTVVLFPALLGLLAAAGLGGLAGLAGGLALLIWGVVAGRGVLGDDRGESDPGRGLVASCAALSGALLGLWVAGWLGTQVVWPWRAPVAVDGARAGDLLLVVRDQSPDAADLLLADDALGAAVLARRGLDGRIVPVGRVRDAEGPWRPRGRVFFRFGGAWGGSVLPGQHPGIGSHHPNGGCSLPCSAPVAYKGT